MSHEAQNTGPQRLHTHAGQVGHWVALGDTHKAGASGDLARGIVMAIHGMQEQKCHRPGTALSRLNKREVEHIMGMQSFVAMMQLQDVVLSFHGVES